MRFFPLFLVIFYSNHHTGTCKSSVQDPLRWGASVQVADDICCFNRHYAERSGSWLGKMFLLLH
jgi:hypothetical protein